MGPDRTPDPAAGADGAATGDRPAPGIRRDPVHAVVGVPVAPDPTHRVIRRFPRCRTISMRDDGTLTRMLDALRARVQAERKEDGSDYRQPVGEDDGERAQL